MLTLDQIVQQMVHEQVAIAEKRITQNLMDKFDRTMNGEETAEYLGISKRKLYNLCSAKKIPHLRIGQAIRFKLSAIDEWLEKQTVE